MHRAVAVSVGWIFLITHVAVAKIPIIDEAFPFGVGVKRQPSRYVFTSTNVYLAATIFAICWSNDDSWTDRRVSDGDWKAVLWFQDWGVDSRNVAVGSY